MTRPIDAILRLSVIVLAVSILLAVGRQAEAMVRCLTPDANGDLQIDTVCDVPGGVTLGVAPKYRYVNITSGGVLNFQDGGDTHFWASAIIVEDRGALTAGTPAAPIGTIKGSRVTIHLWGDTTPSGAAGVPCKSTPTDSCGAPDTIWSSNVDSSHNPKPAADARKVQDLQIDAKAKASYKGPKDDYFYAYHELFHDEGDKHAYFGNKVLAVSYGGTLQLFGKKGACTGPRCEEPDPKDPDYAKKLTASRSYTGTSWVRLKGTATKPAKEGDPQTLTVETPDGGLGWDDGDQIVVTTTDYLPGHSEQLQIKGTPSDNGLGTTTITVEQTLKYTHNGDRYKLPTDPGITKLKLSSDLTDNGAETRAAVGLLSRSIRIVSGGATSGTSLPVETSDECTSGVDPTVNGPNTNKCYFGGHTVFRQGFAAVQIQGVEFYQMGQGGRIGHYPVHFHHARKTQDAGGSLPPTFVKDSSVWDSMTRWIVLHGTQDVIVQRNVGYKSIGHGFYLEDGTETNNKLLANLGVLARAAVASVNVSRGQKTVTAQPDNPRFVPGILVAKNLQDVETKEIPWRTDADSPTVFWIMNGWNDFQYNMAAGANTCGVCYWFLPGWNSTISGPLKWESYASMQANKDRAGMTPLKSFIGNSCTTAMFSFNTVGETDVCHGVGNPGGGFPYLQAISNPLARPKGDLGYFPSINSGGFRKATLGDVDALGNQLTFCNGSDCSVKPNLCAAGPGEEACTVTTLDGFTSSFTFAPYNFAALWLRNQWYLLTNNVITDVQNGGVNFVTGGGYTTSDRIPGLWQLVYKSVFIGQSQPDANVYARDGGPFNADSKLQCDYKPGDNKDPVFNSLYCLSRQEGVTFQVSNFGMGQRLLSFYDGPAVQDSNAYVNIRARELEDCKPELLYINLDCPLDQEDDVVCRINCKDVCKTAKTDKIDCKDVPKDDPILEKHRQCQRAELTSGRCAASPLWTDGNGITHQESHWIAGSVQGLPKGKKKVDDKEVEFCYMPNAAIGWKQPNGFYYPPAFRSRNLFFGKDVDIRHFVIEPLFTENTLTTDLPLASTLYCKFDRNLFTGFTSNDRQTVLLDEDGSLTGFTSDYKSDPPSPLDKTTTIVNLDTLLAAPVEAIECQSERTSRVTPYQYVTTVVYPSSSDGIARADWTQECSNENCYGIPIYRQDALPNFDTEGGKKPFTPKSLRLMGQSTFQRSSITVNNGTYYLNTAVSSPEQGKTAGLHNVFQARGTYYLFTLYAKAKTKQIYQIYVGKSAAFNPQSKSDVWLDQANIAANPVKFGGAIRAFASDEASYDKDTGILTVTLDHSKLSPSFTEATKANCGPKTYCKWATDPDDETKTKEACVDTATGKSKEICRWGPVDLDCPDGGCYAIGLRLPAEFVADDGDHRPTTKSTGEWKCIDKAKQPEWALSLVTASDGTCPKAGEVEIDDFCNSGPTDISVIDGDASESPSE